MSNTFEYEIQHAPAYASLTIKLLADQTIMVESGAMAAMDSHIKIKSKVKGGLMKSVGRMFGGESLFMSEFTAVGKPGELILSPGVPGDITHYPITPNQGLIIQSSGFVACDPNVNLDSKFQGLKGFFSGESLFMLRASGEGSVWICSYGGILEVPVDGSYVVDTGYIVAFEDTLSYQVEVLGGLSWKNLKTSVFGGEGLVCRFSGQGRLWIQARDISPFLGFLNAFRPAKK